MIVEYIRYRIAEPERRAEFEKAYAAASEQLDPAPQCLGYELSHGVEEPDRYILRIEWTSVADHEQGFRGGPHFPPFLAAVQPYIGDIVEMKHYARTSVVSAATGDGAGGQTRD
ncbi:antibiotic biosynthesis monooxygenase family protein [Streptomyces sp. NBC_00989]|uniref:antibiotic biosynthesis monooxygenase family protein n=1 Tax=Streptomyces sp. NBC_00989 TaxID=2903705 RepID=UPI00386C9F67|nr:antibiotic biosynthesis monooxygenase [Streptomyces sp. NBC_00989]